MVNDVRWGINALFKGCPDFILAIKKICVRMKGKCPGKRFPRRL